MASTFHDEEDPDSAHLGVLPRIELVISSQTLTLMTSSRRLEYAVSTAENGIGQISGTGCTPLGRHIIRAKIGAKARVNSVFIGRRLTGEIYSSMLAKAYPKRDWILSRIMWLSGVDLGFNRMGNVDSMRRYIYIHGTPDSEPMGVPRSHGCIRMRNVDVIDLFDRVCPGTPVLIIE